MVLTKMWRKLYRMHQRTVDWKEEKKKIRSEATMATPWHAREYY